MSNKKDDNERVPETLGEALMVISYHVGVFFFKVSLIVVGWLVAVELLREWMM
jgi:hypothetical protein